jgi:hypothetical protein
MVVRFYCGKLAAKLVKNQLFQAFKAVYNVAIPNVSGFACPFISPCCFIISRNTIGLGKCSTDLGR